MSAPLVELFRPGSLGDLLMMTALFRAFKKKGYRVRCICSSSYFSILEDNPDLENLIVLPPGHNLYINDAYRYAEQVTGEKADRSYYFEYSKWWEHPGLPTQVLHEHVLMQNCRKMDIPYCDELTVHLTDEMLEWGSQFSNAILIQTKTHWSPYKNWSMYNWLILVDLIQNHLKIPVLQIGHANDPGLPNVQKIETSNIRIALAALKSSKLFIGLDSVFNHGSRAVGKKSVILWGSTNPTAFAYEQNINMVNGIPWDASMGNGPPLLRCQPCYRENKHIEASKDYLCPYTVPYPTVTPEGFIDINSTQHHCMANNMPVLVFEQLKKLL